jgi:hypothetical protein
MVGFSPRLFYFLYVSFIPECPYFLIRITLFSFFSRSIKEEEKNKIFFSNTTSPHSDWRQQRNLTPLSPRCYPDPHESTYEDHFDRSGSTSAPNQTRRLQVFFSEDCWPSNHFHNGMQLIPCLFSSTSFVNKIILLFSEENVSVNS